MANISDQQLIQYLQQGRREALAQLFDRYGADLYDFLARLVGDRDQAARLLEEVFMRVPGAVAGLPARESVRGWLYSLAREAGLTWLRQRGWLDGLPPQEEPGPAGLAGDIWRAARAMPAFYRAVLILEELHSLSPTEKARALGVQRTDLPRLVDEARKSFTRIFDAQARAAGRPTSAQIDPDRIIGLRRRINTPGASLFGFLPVIVMPDSLQQALRQRIVQAMSGQVPRPIEESPAETPPMLPPAAEVAEPEPQPEPQPEPETVSAVTTTTTVRREQVVPPRGVTGALPAWALAAAAGVALAVVVCGLVYLFLVRDVTPPVVDAVQPPDGASIQQADQLTVSVLFHDDHGVDPQRCCKLMIDTDDVTALSAITQRSITWSGPLNVGTHVVTTTIADQGGNVAPPRSWHFNVITGTVTVTPTPLGTQTIPSATALATLTPLPTATSSLPTETPSPTATPLTPTAIPLPPTATLVPPTATPCMVAIYGSAYIDLNGNQVHDPNEPTLSGVIVNLQNASGGTISSAITNSFGGYQFINLPFGTYRVQAQTPAGWTATTPTIVTVNMFGCGSVVVDFGFLQNTPVPPPTATNTTVVIPPTATNTTVPPTATNTTVPPTATNTTVPPSLTDTPTATPTLSAGQVQNQITVSGISTASTAAVCPGGYKVVGGGYAHDGSLNVYQSTIQQASNGWLVGAINPNAGATVLTVYAICLNLSGTTAGFPSPLPAAIPGGGTNQTFVNCPIGQPLTGGGFTVSPSSQNLTVYSDAPQGPATWLAAAKSTGPPGSVTAIAVCYNGTGSTSQVNQTYSVPPGLIFASYAAACPSGTTLTSGGFAGQPGVMIRSSAPSGNTWQVFANNTNASPQSLTVTAICGGF